MKVISKFLFGMCCLAAITACSNSEEPVINTDQPHEMTLSVNTGADTRTELTENGTALKRVWKAGDKISVIFQKDDNNYHEIFTLSSGEGTTAGKFYNASSMLPTTGTQNFHLQYPAGTVDGNWVESSIATQGDGSLSSVGDYEVLVGWNKSITDGVWSSITLDQSSIILHISTDVTLVNNATGTMTVSSLVLSGTHVANEYGRNFSGVGNRTVGNITLSDLTLVDGKLQNDAYIVFMQGGGYAEDLKLTLTIDDTDYVVELNNHSTPSDYGIYHLAESSIKAVPSM